MLLAKVVSIFSLIKAALHFGPPSILPSKICPQRSINEVEVKINPKIYLCFEIKKEKHQNIYLKSKFYKLNFKKK